MIVLRNLTKYFQMNGHRKYVARQLNAVFPTGKAVALLGRNGAGKSTMLRMIAGLSSPNRGEILTDGRISYPVGLANSMHPDMTGAQNALFVARVYGADTESMIEFVQAFSDLGPHFNMPVRTYSSGMRSRLSLGINMALDFDTYLVDEVTAVGDAAFVEKSRKIILNRVSTSSAIFVSHSMSFVKTICDAGAVLEDGQLTYFPDLEEAIARHTRNMGV
ncbi:ABC transporter ATP-binding protein [Paracoccus aerodenitrificans]|uniref:ABC transporter ATP-binding protein n=1 Tax=Paracoccus aerodenitrificans TaxID=3017781 RepID=UPI0022EFE584|nr:ABC transporter ATP-binding protein [Paracoccus aerodenitrificans]WBU63889.1 ABC transporter ATP-binding protein [Paracoccus aerodenitrificans]